MDDTIIKRVEKPYLSHPERARQDVPNPPSCFFLCKRDKIAYLHQHRLSGEEDRVTLGEDKIGKEIRISSLF